MASTSNLLSNIGRSGGFSRPNIYDMTITPPAGMDMNALNLQRVSLNCNVSGLPGRSVAAVEHSQGGDMVRKIPHSVMISDLTTSFYLSADLYEKRFFDSWQDMIYDPATGTLGWYDDYVTDISITKKKFGRNETHVGTYTFHEAYPMTIMDTPQGYDLENQVTTIQVLWAYREWSFRR